MNRMKLSSACAATLAVAALALASAAAAAPNAARGLDGVWSGKTKQDIAPLAEGADFVDWSQRITVRTMNGRLTYLGLQLRYTCPSETSPLAGDIAISQGWKTGAGPKLTGNGGFRLTLRETTNRLTGKPTRLFAPVHVSGVLGAGSAGGRFDVSKGNCSGKGSWQARRRF